MGIDIRSYKKVETLKEFSARKGILSENATRSWADGKRSYLEEREKAVKVGRDWLIFTS